MNEAGISRVSDNELLALAAKAMQYSYSPYSKFKVGACLLAADGRVFTGCNIENASYGATNCAERTALFKAVSDGAHEFVAIAIATEKALAWPCGICRQALCEFAPHLRVITACGDQRAEATLDQLLYGAFGPVNGTGDYLGKDKTQMTKIDFKSGFVAVVGRPNVGKSTLVNTLVGEKIAIVSDRPQTTRNRLLGVMSGEGYQMVFVDTPGIHKPRTQLGSYMMQAVQSGLEGIDALLMMVDVPAVGPQDRKIAEDMAKKGVPAILLLNKCDLIDNERVLPVIDQFKEMGFAEILPISAKASTNLELLTQELLKLMPTGPRYFPEDMITDQPERVLCAEIVREKALLHLRDEVPHGVGVEILGMKKVNDNLMEIHADIYCERDSHKAIIIGKRGAMLSLIDREARVDMEALLGMRVNLQLWVKVRPDWRNSAADLKTLGYDSKEMR